MRVSHQGNRLTINDRIITLPHPIEETLLLSDRVIVLLDTDDYAANDPMLERNVFAISNDGKILWQIEESKGRIEDGEEISLSAFSWIGLGEDGVTLQAYEWGGLQHDVDPRTGKLSNTIFTR